MPAITGSTVLTPSGARIAPRPRDVLEPFSARVEERTGGETAQRG
jgi:hypothetical protein